jgi:carboxypeptidase T
LGQGGHSMKRSITSFLALSVLLVSASGYAHSNPNKSKFISIDAQTREARTRLLELGINIEEVYSDRVWSLVTDEEIVRLKSAGFKVLTSDTSDAFFRTRDSWMGKGPQFPSKDSRYHDFSELRIALNTLQKKYPRISRLETIGKSWEGREIIALHLNSSIAELESGHSNKPGIVFMGAHHAREHLSSEIPRMLAEHLLDHQGEAQINTLLNTRDIWIIPMVNPDGAEFDIEGGSYHLWRKNRRLNEEDSYGVDLNRNYGFQWGTGGSSTNSSSDTYMGPEPFSEPESQAIRDFVSDHLNLKVLLSYHTYSELILYPWGHSYDPIPNQKDRQTFETMAKTMARWNGYKPQQSSQLYIASGDTTDWAYGTYGIFAFTFELTPKGMLGGGFYPGENVIDSTFRANLNPALYLIDLADAPTRAVDQGPGASIWYK